MLVPKDAFMDLVVVLLIELSGLDGKISLLLPNLSARNMASSDDCPSTLILFLIGNMAFGLANVEVGGELKLTAGGYGAVLKVVVVGLVVVLITNSIGGSVVLVLLGIFCIFDPVLVEANCCFFDGIWMLVDLSLITDCSRSRK